MCSYYENDLNDCCNYVINKQMKIRFSPFCINSACYTHVDPRLHHGEVGEIAVHGVKREAVYACEDGVHLGTNCMCIILCVCRGLRMGNGMGFLLQGWVEYTCNLDGLMGHGMGIIFAGLG